MLERQRLLVSNTSSYLVVAGWKSISSVAGYCLRWCSGLFVVGGWKIVQRVIAGRGMEDSLGVIARLLLI